MNRFKRALKKNALGKALCYFIASIFLINLILIPFRANALTLSPENTSSNLAVTEAGFDDMGKVLEDMGYKATKISTSDLGSKTKLSKYDAVYVNCSGSISSVTDKTATVVKEYVENQKNEFKAREKAIEGVLPELQSLYNLNLNKPGISYFEGILGIKKIYESISRRENQGEVLVFRSIYDDELLGEYILKHIKKLTLVGIKSRLLNPSGHPITNEVEGVKLDREIKHIDITEFHLPTEISVFGNKVAFISLKKDKIGVVIESADFAETMRSIFETLWNKNDTKTSIDKSK